MEATTSAAVKGVPSLKTTPRRSVNTYVLASGCFQEVARPGSRSPAGVTDSRDSWTRVATR